MELFNPYTAVEAPKSNDDNSPPKRPNPEPEYPHLTHDMNALSHYFLETTAFNGRVSMSTADALRRSGKTISECYASISKSNQSPAPMFATRTQIVDLTDLNYDRIGILFEYHNHYYVIVNGPPEKATPHGVTHGFLAKDRVGMPLIYEWESIPKRLVAPGCFGATGSTEGWWHVHSTGT